MTPSASGPGRALVMGLGRFGGGAGTTRFLCREGWRVTLTDTAPAEALEAPLRSLADLDVELALGGHRPEDFERADWVVANPAVRRDHPLLERARRHGARVTSEAELFLERVEGPLLLVTGTQGKSSTAHFAAQLVRAAGRPVHLGGNIGVSLLGALLDARPGDAWVVELSSYQLDALPRPGEGRVPRRATAVAVTNVLADHLERHGTREAYAAAKGRLLECAAPGAPAFLPADLPEARAWPSGGERRVLHGAAGDPGLGSADLVLAEDRATWNGEGLGDPRDLRVPGPFQRRNLLVALGLARALGLAPAELARAVGSLAGLPHRLDDLGMHAGHRVWDNAVSTTPDSTVSALEALGGPCTLLCGGQAKELDYDALARAAARRARRVVVFGRHAAELSQRFAAAGCDVERCDELAEAVRAAFRRMGEGEELLFSPACASFDAYANFEERARDFRAALSAATAELETAP